MKFPLSFLPRKDGVFKRGIAPKYAYRESKGDKVPLLIFPPPLSREGDKGGGLPNKNKILKEMKSINNSYNIS